MNNIIFDLEATCWDNDKTKQHETIEIGAVKIVDGLVVDKFQKFIRPITNPILSDFCIKLTTIEQKHVDSAADFPVVIQEFKDWIGNDYLLCSWGFFDKEQLVLDSNTWNLPIGWIIEKHISIKHQYTEIKNLKKHVGLGRALKIENLQFEGVKHRGIDDAINTGKIFVKYIDKWKH